jgi:hypothetical protein
MASGLKWYGPEVQHRIRREMEKRIAAASIVVLNHARELISVAGTGGGEGRKRRYGSDPSAPGEPPHKQYGHLRRSVMREAAGLVGRVGTNLKYGRWLELGTRKMAARPWLRRSLDEKRAEVKRIVEKPILGGRG